MTFKDTISLKVREKQIKSSLRCPLSLIYWQNSKIIDTTMYVENLAK